MIDRRGCHCVRVQGVDQLEQRGDAAGVVVGAVVDVADRAVAVPPRAVADVVVVGADEDVFAAAARVGPGRLRQQVLVAGVEPLQVAAVVAAPASCRRSSVAISMYRAAARPPRLPASRPSSVSSASRPTCSRSSSAVIVATAASSSALRSCSVATRCRRATTATAMPHESPAAEAKSHGIRTHSTFACVHFYFGERWRTLRHPLFGVGTPSGGTLGLIFGHPSACDSTAGELHGCGKLEPPARPSFADAELAEHAVEHVVGAHGADDFADGVEGRANLRGHAVRRPPRSARFTSPPPAPARLARLPVHAPRSRRRPPAPLAARLPKPPRATRAASSSIRRP